MANKEKNVEADQPESGKLAAKYAEVNAILRGGFGTTQVVGNGTAEGAALDMNARLWATYGNGDNNGAGIIQRRDHERIRKQ